MTDVFFFFIFDDNVESSKRLNETSLRIKFINQTDCSDFEHQMNLQSHRIDILT